MDGGRQGAWVTPAVALGAGAGLVALLAWFGVGTAEGRIGDRALLAQAPGTPVVLSLQAVTGLLDDRHYAVGRRSLRFVVEGDPAGLALGDDVTVGGHVGDGVVVEEWRETAPGRPAKRRLGLLGLALLPAMVLGTTRPGAGGWRAAWPTS